MEFILDAHIKRAHDNVVDGYFMIKPDLEKKTQHQCRFAVAKNALHNEFSPVHPVKGVKYYPLFVVPREGLEPDKIMKRREGVFFCPKTCLASSIAEHCGDIFF
jgi:hypothetical protein